MSVIIRSAFAGIPLISCGRLKTERFLPGRSWTSICSLLCRGWTGRKNLCVSSTFALFSMNLSDEPSDAMPERAEGATLYPPIEPYFVGEITAGIHTVYYELSGNPNGLPVLFVHGGPGGGTEPTHRRFFNPNSKLKPMFTFSTLMLS